MVTKDQERTVFAAIADPTRRAILDQMRHGEVNAGDLAKRFPISRPAIARHVRILRSAGLLQQRAVAQRRYYSLKPAALAEVDQWLAPFRLFWSARMVDIKAVAENLSDLKEEESDDEE
ncbi:MAG: metalloregulator ArsR/SmtB family transcription factor [Pseudomonadota bacterium]